jgi:hypothetical protein
MNAPDEPIPGKRAPKPKPSRQEEALRIIEEYAAGLREIIKKLRHKFHEGRLSWQLIAVKPDERCRRRRAGRSPFPGKSHASAIFVSTRCTKAGLR